MTRLHLTIRRKLFSHEQVEPLGSMPATATKTPHGYVVALGRYNGTDLPAFARSIIRYHVREFLKDTRYCFLWNEDTGFETECKLI